MLASTGPERLMLLIPGRLKAGPVAESAHGIIVQLHAEACAEVSGASDAPKSTPRFVMARMPLPEPMLEYWTLPLPAELKSGANTLSTSGATSDEPAPVSVPPPAEALAGMLTATAAPTALTASSARMAVVRFIELFLLSSACANQHAATAMTSRYERV